MPEYVENQGAVWAPGRSHYIVSLDKKKLDNVTECHTFGQSRR